MQHANGYQTLLKYARKHFYLIFSSFLEKLNQKRSLLVRSEILRVFVNTLTADDKYNDYLHYRESLVKHIKATI